MIAGVIVVGLVGILCVVIGLLLWRKEKISLLHDYHYNKVSEDNKKAFCTLSGLGVLSIGASLILTAVLLAFTNSALSFLAFAIGFVVGIALLVYAGKKYNT